MDSNFIPDPYSVYRIRIIRLPQRELPGQFYRNHSNQVHKKIGRYTILHIPAKHPTIPLQNVVLSLYWFALQQQQKRIARTNLVLRKYIYPSF